MRDGDFQTDRNAVRQTDGQIDRQWSAVADIHS